jgi:hypothetical protein
MLGGLCAGKVRVFVVYVFLLTSALMYQKAPILKSAPCSNKNFGREPAVGFKCVWQVANSGARWMALPCCPWTDFVNYSALQNR